MSARYKQRREQEKARALAQIDGVLKAEYEGELDPSVETSQRIQFLNCLYYCKAHARDICGDCKLFSLKLRNLLNGFQLPDNNVPDLPWQCIQIVQADPSREEEATLLAQRWLWMQQVYYSNKVNKMPAFHEYNMHLVKLPPLSKIDEATASVDEIRRHLLPTFEALRGIAGSQRYHFALQSSVLITDFHTFSGGKEVLEEGFAVLFDTESSLQLSGPVRSLLTAEVEPDEENLSFHLQGQARMQEKAKFHILNAFGYLLENRTTSSFWRILELTATSLMDHVNNFDEEEDGQTVMTEKAKRSLIQLITQVFWALLYSQHQLQKVRNLQHQICQKSMYPFYSYHLPALEADLDIHLLVLKLSTVNLWNVPHVIYLLQDFKLACEQFPEQVNFIDPSVMGAVDEFAARFQALRLALNAAQFLLPEAEVKLAITKYRFDVKDKDVSARHDELLGLSETYRDVTKLRTPGLVGDVPTLYRLISKENRFRRFHSKDFFMMFDEAEMDSEITEKQFEALRAKYLHLFPAILSHWGEDERSLLPSAEAKRLKQNEKSAQKKEQRSKRRHKQKCNQHSGAGGGGGGGGGGAKAPQMDTSDDDRAQALDHEQIPASACMEPKLFWPEMELISLDPDHPLATSDEPEATPASPKSPRGERAPKSDSLLPLPVCYFLHFVRSDDCVFDENERPHNRQYNSNGSLDSPASSPQAHRNVDRINTQDMRTRDILWGKTNHTLEWSDLKQLLEHLGCEIEHLLGSRRRVTDPFSRRSVILYEPHGKKYCRPDEKLTYHIIIENLLGIKYEELITPREKLPV
ncbi:hypothetical protein MPTK1_5g07210 [Marchantia polymorpha subsp. ruderalis]|nr:hypothetical protein MARPO_0136s0001 [Marchantia polymorpha]BBN10879.1 hypothetical protein Mp_5g07210 [Marchantia polymorpha subsp. ruderalis]|eukprot:PTQ29671.1 hypothetical protein MARPO_0136s0001 [Marchantia polymorpha]